MGQPSAAFVAPGASAVGMGTDSIGTPLVELTCTQGAAPPVAPDSSITKRPKKKIRIRKVTFKFASDQPGSTFECSFDGAAFKACVSPENYIAKRGRHRFAGITDPTPATAKFKVVPRAH